MTRLYQVYAVGSAIVDFEFKLTQEKDWPCELEKGGTLLIDSEKEKWLLEKLAKVSPVKSCGGSGANTLSVVSGLGGRVFYSCQVAKDAAGDFYHQDLQACRIASNLDEGPKAAGTTGKSLIVVGADGDRVLCTSYGASGLLMPADLNEEVMAQSQYLFVEAFLATVPSSKLTALTALQLARQLGCKTALTITTCKMAGFDRKHFFDLIGPSVDLLFCNELEASYMCASSNLGEIQEKLKTLAQQFVITRGAKATLVYDGKETVEVPTCPVTVSNSTGAGDIFAGAFLQAQTHGASPTEATTLANFAASKVLAKNSARLSSQDFTAIRNFTNTLA